MKLLTPDFDTCQGRVLQRRKGSALYVRWIWRSGRVPRLEILLTEEGEINLIFGLQFGKSYLFFRVVLFLKIESCFAVIGNDCVSVGDKYEPPQLL
jgi:hypothetical protein